MDKGRGQKIRGYFLLWGLLLGIGFLSLCLLHQQDGKVSEQQIREMVIMHPELEQEVHNSFAFYREQRMEGYYIAFVLYAMLTAGILGVSLFLTHQRLHRDNALNNRKIEAVLQQIEAFQKGDFSVAYHQGMADMEAEDSEPWDHIWGRIRELGYYLEGMKEKLSQEENSTKTLISDISHQLKTPLASLKMSHELLQGDDLSPQEREEFFHKEGVEIERMLLLLQELVKLSRLENYMIQLAPERASMKKTITEAVNVVIIKAVKKQIEVQMDMPQDIIVLHDSQWTVEAISNVLDNAIKYSGENSTIQISVETLPNLLLLEIEDEGIGIPAHEVHRIYQRFYRGKEAMKLSKDGVGLGLYLSRRILEQQGGSIVAKRKQSGGTIFRITFPL